MSEEKFTLGEQRFIEEVCGKPFFRGWVDVWKEKKKKKIKRILAVGSYRILAIKRTALGGKKSVTKDFHLYDLLRLMVEPKKIILEFRHPKTQSDSTAPTDEAVRASISQSSETTSNQSIIMEIHTDKTKEIANAIRSAFRIISVGFLPTSIFTLDTTDQKLIKDMDPNFQPGLASGFRESYRAWCDYRKISVHDEFLYYLEQKIQQGFFEFELNDCPGVEGVGDGTIHFGPICDAFRFNTHFRSFCITNFNRKDLISNVASMMRTNYYLTKLVLRNLEGGVSTEKWAELGEALRLNPQHGIQVLDISHNKLGFKGVNALIGALQSFKHGLISLNISKCGIGSKAMQGILYALVKHYALSITIQDLDLSHNSLDEVGSNALQTWLLSLKTFSKLRRLMLGSTNLNVMCVARSFTALPLVEVDLSRNKIDIPGCAVLCTAFDSSQTLKIFTASHCSMSGDSACKLVKSIITNRKLSQVRIDISDNGLTEKDAQDLALALQESRNLQILNIGYNKFKDIGMNMIFTALITVDTLDTLICDHCFRGSSRGAEQVASGLSSLIACNPSLKTVSLVAIGKKIVELLLQPLQSNQNLTSLDISENKLGDSGAYAVSHFLRRNNTLLHLGLDRNGIGLNGWLAIRSALSKNNTLQTLPFPWKDYTKCLNHLSDQLTTKLRDIMDDIQGIVGKNGRTGAKLRPKPVLFDELTRAPHSIEPLGESSLRLSERKEDLSIPVLTEDDAEGTEYIPVRESFVQEVDEVEYDDEDDEETYPPPPSLPPRK